jgi:peptide chain release factor
MFKTDNDLSGIEGTVQWICQSPFRPNHKRKNWFVDVSIIPDAEEICKDQNIRFERFHSGGNGGQNVNKVETGVRLIHIPTGITVTSTAERTQQLNRKDALQKLNAILSEKEAENKAKQTNDAWREHTRIVRGNPVRVYKGMGFVQTD